MLDTIAIIPARSVSKGVIDKNIRLLSGRPLIAYSIKAALLAENSDPDDEEIEISMRGNLCRCMTYKRIKEAIKKAGKTMRERSV